MLLWCNEAFGASEAEDQLTASSLISHPALFEEIHSLWGLTLDHRTMRDYVGTLVNSCNITWLIEFA